MEIKNKIKAICVTGALGFIGSYVTGACLSMGWYVKGIDKITYAANKNLLTEFNKHPNFSFIQSDINDLEFLYDCDYIINCAAETHVGNSIIKSDDFIHSNIDGVHHLLELIRNFRQEGKDVPILLHFSTDEVYGDIKEGEHIETDMLKPSNPYSATKAAADLLITAWSRTYDLPYIIVRPTNNYGDGQYVEKLIPKACKYLKLGRKIPLHNNGTPIRNWLHASDTAEAIIRIIESGNKNEIYNICGGFELSNLEVIKKIIILYHKLEFKDDREHIILNEIIKYVDFSYSRPGQDIRYALNDDKLRKLGWVPRIKFDEILPSIIEQSKNKFIW